MTGECRLPVNRILPFSCVDGPGNRMAIFVQGCPLRCLYCHNPETITPCRHCGDCVPACPAGALSLNEGIVDWDEESCSDCGACLKACPHLSSPKVRGLGIPEIVGRIRPAAPFLSGITVSGGEATLYARELILLFRELRSAFPSLSRFIDTNGAVDLGPYPELLELCDGFMVDLKSADPGEYKRLTGGELEQVLANIALLKEAGKLYEIRTVIAPGLDNEKTVRLGASLAASDCIYKLIPYRPYGVRPDGLAFHGRTGPDEEEMEGWRRLAEASGASNIELIRPEL